MDLPSFELNSSRSIENDAANDEDTESRDSREMSQKLFDSVPHILQLNIRSDAVQSKLLKTKLSAKPTYVDQLIASKSDLERQLLLNDQTSKALHEKGISLLSNAIYAKRHREHILRRASWDRFQKLTEEIREEQTLSDEKVEAITARWSQLETIDDPRNLNDALETQKHNIAEVVALKDRTIQLLRDEIDRLHKIFYDYSDQQKKDAQIMCEQTVNHLNDMKECIAENMQIVSDIIERQRHQFLHNATFVWAECQSQANQIDNNHEQLQIVQAEHNAVLLNGLRVDLSERLRAHRLRLDSERDSFHLFMEKFKVRTMLKADQMRYNHHVLQLKCNENVMTISERRRQLNKVQTEIIAYETKIKQLSGKYMEDLTRIRTQTALIDESNFRWQEMVGKRVVATAKTYKNLWNMHEKEIVQRLTAVYACDQKIFEQILLKKWKSPATVHTAPLDHADAFDLENFVKNFQYLPLHWQSHLGMQTTTATPGDHDAATFDTFLADQTTSKAHIMETLNGKHSVLRIPTLDDVIIDRYWTQFSHYFNTDRKQTWRMLATALREFVKLLQRREKLANKCNLQRRRHIELQFFSQNVSATNAHNW